MKTSASTEHWLSIYDRLPRRICMLSGFTQSISFLIKTSYKKEPTKHWKLSAFVWERLMDFYMFMAFIFPPPRHFSLVMFCFWLSAYPNMRMQQGPDQRQLRRKLAGRQGMVSVLLHTERCVLRATPECLQGTSQTCRSTESLLLTELEMPTLTSVCSSFFLIKGFFLSHSVERRAKKTCSVSWRNRLLIQLF